MSYYICNIPLGLDLVKASTLQQVWRI